MPPSRLSSRDISLGTGNWQGGASDGITLWFVDGAAGFARAYVAATGARDASKDINIGSGVWFGGTSDGTTVWLIVRVGSTYTARAYVAATQARDAAKDISFSGGGWSGGASDSTTLWFVNDTTDTAVAYVAATQARDAAKDISLGTGNWTGGGESNGITLWFVDSTTAMAVAYTAATQAQDSDNDIDLGTGAWGGGASDGGILWFVDTGTDMAVAYETLPDAEAPTVAIAPIGTVDEGATQSLTAALTGGTYDALAYLWEVVSGGGTITNPTSANATYNAPAVASDIPAQVRLTVTATGTGTNAADGTSDDGTDTENFTVRNVPVVTTDTDSIYQLSAAAPAAPAGGTGVEEHTPAGWTRTEPAATETQAVYRSQRTRSFSDGTFTSATVWGAPAILTQRLLALSDYTTPSGFTDDFVAMIEAEVSAAWLFRSDTPVGTLLEGDLALDGADITIQRVGRRNSGATMRLIRFGADPIDLAFGTGGAYDGSRITVQTLDATIEINAPGDVQTASSSATRLDLDVAAGEQAAFNAIATGTRFILAISRIAGEEHEVDAGDVAWAFMVPQPTVTYTAPPSYAVDAGNVAWAFAIPQPTVTYTPPAADAVDAGDVDWAFAVSEPTVTYTAPASDTVDAGDVAWAFAVPQPTVTYRAPGAAGVNAGDVAWAFDIPQPTVTYRAPASHNVDAGDVAWVFAVPQPTVTYAPPLIQLADWDDAGLEVETAALLEASGPGTSGSTFYADSSRGGSDTPLDGELGVGPGETAISRMRRANAANLNLNDDNLPGALDLGVFFGAGGAGEDLTLYLQTGADGVVSFTVASAFLNAGPDILRLTPPTAAITLLDNLATGDRIIFALARTAAEPSDDTVDAGDVAWAFDLPQPTVTYTPPGADTVDAGDVAWAFQVTQPTVTYRAPASQGVNAGDVAWAFSVPQPTVTYRAPADHAVNAGDVAWTFTVPQPTVTYGAPAQDDTVDAGDVAWAFSVPQPTVTYRPPGGIPFVPEVPALVATSDVQDPVSFRLKTTADLLITQWRNQPRMRAVTEIWLEVVQEELLDPLNKMREYMSLERAEGVWLERLGVRLGVKRPWTTRASTAPIFGFDQSGDGFDQGLMYDPDTVQPRAPIADLLYRALLYARVVTLTTPGTFPSMEAALALVDPNARVEDNNDMSFNVHTGRRADIELAARAKCLPIPAGVQMIIVDRGAFGFDQAGVGFDQGHMAS